MPTESELLNMIAAAQRQLASLQLIPKDEPKPAEADDDDVIIFRVDVKGRDGQMITYVTLRTSTGSWYITGRDRNVCGTYWSTVRDFFSQLRVVSFTKLGPMEDPPQ